MDIRKLDIIQRKGNRSIDIQATMQEFAKELISWSDEEKAIRTNRRYREAVRRAFARFPGVKRIPIPALVVTALQNMKFDARDYKRMRIEMEKHISFNRGGYLRTVPGKGGGVELTKP